MLNNNQLLEYAAKAHVSLQQKKIPLSQLRKGFADEWKEHSQGKFNVTNGDKLKTIKIALAHLVKNPSYYS